MCRRTVLTAILLTGALLAGCTSDEHRAAVILKPQTPKPPGWVYLNAKRASDCEFRAYKPLQVSDWLPKGIARKVEPVYPEQAMRRRVQGTVSVAVLINQDGEVERVCSTGPSLLRSAAEEAAIQWRFHPPVLNGTKIPYVREVLSFNFALGGTEQR